MIARMGSTDDDDDPHAAPDRAIILARRRRFVAAALTGLTTSTLVTACPCLKIAAPDQPEPSTGHEPEVPEDTERQDDGDAAEDAMPVDVPAETAAPEKERES